MNNMYEPIIKSLMEELDCERRHNGLDIRLKYDHGDVNPQDRGPRSYEIMNQGRPFGKDVYPAKSIQYLIDDVIKKYFEEHGSVKEKSQELVEKGASELKTFPIKNGKYIKEIRETETGYDFYTVDGNDAPAEVQQIAADLWNLLAISKEGIEDKTMYVNDQLKIGTLDSDKNTKELLIHTPNGLVPYGKEYVPQSLLLTTMWYMLKLHQGTKQFLNYINLEVSYKGYTAKITKGEVSLVTEGQSQLVIDIYTDLRRME
jgi:hypothetical protein